MQKRIALWDNLKLFLIFLVVLGHLTIQYFSKSQMFGTMTMAIYTFHMPAFVFVSGLFSKSAINSDTPPVKKSVSFLLIYIFLRIANYTANIIFGVKCAFDFFSAKDIPWYMLAMAIWYMASFAIKNAEPKYVLTVSVIIACFAGYMTGDTDFLCVLRVVTFYPFFYAGYALDRQKIEEITAKKASKIASAVIFVSFILICTLTFYSSSKLFPLLSGRRRYSALGEYAPWGCLIRLAYFAVAGALVFAVISLCPRKEFAISKYGRRTLQIYFFHRPLMYIMKNAGLFYLIRLLGEGWEWLAIVVMVGLTAILALPFWGKPLEYLLKPIERKNYAAAK